MRYVPRYTSRFRKGSRDGARPDLANASSRVSTMLTNRHRVTSHFAYHPGIRDTASLVPNHDSAQSDFLPSSRFGRDWVRQLTKLKFGYIPRTKGSTSSLQSGAQVTDSTFVTRVEFNKLGSCYLEHSAKCGSPLQTDTDAPKMHLFYNVSADDFNPHHPISFAN